ncbi:MAG: OmpA family protein [Clostridia bacterium]|nr:OmpA family protein [Clostridia bacterium]
MRKLLALLLCLTLLPFCALGEGADALAVELEITKAKLARANAEIDALYEEIAGLLLQLRQTAQTPPVAEDHSDAKALEEANAEIVALKAELQALQATYQLSTETLAEREGQIVALKAELQALQATYQLSTETLTEREGQIAELKSAADEAQTTIAQLQTQIAELKSAADEAQTALAEKESLLEQQVKELSAAQKELAHAHILMQQQQAELNSRMIAISAAQKELENQKNAFLLQTSKAADMVGVRSGLISDLSAALNAHHISSAIDPNSGAVTMDSRMLTFESNEATLSAESKSFLDAFVPVYLDVLLKPEYADYIDALMIEGHTDPSGTYGRNYALSQERALEVLLYIRSMYQHDSLTLARLDQLLVATGKGYTDPVYNSYGYPDPDASRRVEFRFVLRDTEMIEEINRLLNGQ